MHHVLATLKPKLMVEFGSFMGGSAIEWIANSRDTHLICVDPWPNELAEYVANLEQTEWARKLYRVEELRRYAQLLKNNSTISVVRNNLWPYRERITMVQGKAPAIYKELAPLKPDLVYIDAMKVRTEFIEAHEAFPHSMITGDDWTWPDSQGHFPVRDFVAEIAALRGARVFADRQTFVVVEPHHGIEFDPKYEYRHPKMS